MTLAPLAERFWAKVDKRGPDECWLWQGTKRGSRSNRYGAIMDGGRQRPAHVVAWELEHGQPFPEGMFGCHSCDNPPCVNPAHIWPGTASDNAVDAQRKGRLKYQGWAFRTTCVHGHPVTPENTYIPPSRNSPRCRTCDHERPNPPHPKTEEYRARSREWTRRYEAKKRAERLAALTKP